jgi:prepilin-type N-terminal cleavage/methylation domain-containing protein
MFITDVNNYQEGMSAVRPAGVRNVRGFTMIELLVAAFLTGIVALAALSFHSSIHQQVLSQQEISDMQQNNRACLEELSTALKSAGYGLPEGHPAFEVNGDSLSVYLGDTGGVDTVLYYTEEFTDIEYAEKMIGRVEGMTVLNLMKKRNSEPGVMFADFVTDLRFTSIGTKLLAITLEVQTSRPDDTYSLNHGFRTFINTERVVVRNITS